MHKKILAAVMLIGGSNVSYAMQVKKRFVVGNALMISFVESGRESVYWFTPPYEKIDGRYSCQCLPVLTKKFPKPHHGPKKMRLSEATLCRLLSIKKVEHGGNLVEAIVKTAKRKRIQSSKIPHL